MNQPEKAQEGIIKDVELYSSKAICGATFLGGPLAGGYMIGENFKALGKPKDGRNAIIIGIISTIIVFVGIFMIPENTLDNIPRQLIPIIYTGIIWGIVEWKQGEILKAHKENGNSFYSGWRAAGIGFISLIIISVGIFGYVFWGMDNQVYEQYDNEISTFSKNETESLVFYEHLETETNHNLLKELENITIPKWEENIEIIKRTNGFEKLPSELAQQNKILLKYSELRVEAFKLFKKSFEEDTEKYYQQIEKIHQQINEQLEKLN